MQHKHFLAAVSRRYRVSGFTLVELLIAMVLGGLVSLGLLQVYQSNKQSYRLNEAQSRMQENARYALEVLSKDLRQAGYQGCRSMNETPPFVPTNTTANAWVGTFYIRGNNGSTATPPVSTWTPAFTNANFGFLPNLFQPATGTDVVHVQFAESCGGFITGDMADPAVTTTDPIVISGANSCAINAGDVLLASDCSQAVIFPATGYTTAAGSGSIAHAAFPNPPGIRFRPSLAPEAEAFRFRFYSYYIGTGASGRAALFRRDNMQATAQEIVDGIENMQIQYGMDTDASSPDCVATPNDGIVNQYQDPALATEWCRVVSLRIHLLAVSSEDNLTDDKQKYKFVDPDTTITASDRRLRRVFTTTIDVRNQ